MIRHGNYDFKTQGVAEWGGGANHALAPSMYYASRTAFFGNCTWPAFGPDVSGITSTQPAKNRFEGGTVCTGTGPGTPPAPPTNLRILSSTE
jgi:hypothetical protein